MSMTFETPMSMAAFFKASHGTWLNRRAVHHLDHQDDEVADSNLIIEPFNQQDPDVIKICNNLNVKTEDCTGGARFWWESNTKKGVRNDDYAAVVIDLPQRGDSTKGFLLRDVGYVERNSVISTYNFASDGVLTITTRYDSNVGIERCWFVTDQLRMRVSSVQCLDGVAMTTYCTEFRCPTDDEIREVANRASDLAERTPIL